LEKLPHECGTRKGLQVFARDEDGEVDGYCFSCSTYVRHPYGEKRMAEDLPSPNKKSQEEIDIEIAEIDSLPTIDVVASRLRGETLKKFNVKVGLSEQDGKTPSMMCYPYYKDGELRGYKVKLLEQKRFWSIGDLKDVDAFGWDQAIKRGSRRLIVTEGEDDAMIWDRILEMYVKNEDFKDYTSVISLPHGASQAKAFFTKNLKRLKDSFQEILLSFDMDEAGRDAVKSVITVFPEAKDINLPCKDAKECVLQGKSKAAYNSLFKSAKPKTSRLVFAEDIHEKAKEPAQYGQLTWPWDHINMETRGIRFGETIYLGAGVDLAPLSREAV
jgi:twinkle protein